MNHESLLQLLILTYYILSQQRLCNTILNLCKSHYGWGGWAQPLMKVYQTSLVNCMKIVVLISGQKDDVRVLWRKRLLNTLYHYCWLDTWMRVLWRKCESTMEEEIIEYIVSLLLTWHTHTHFIVIIRNYIVQMCYYFIIHFIYYHIFIILISFPITLSLFIVFVAFDNCLIFVI